MITYFLWWICIYHVLEQGSSCLNTKLWGYNDLYLGTKESGSLGKDFEDFDWSGGFIKDSILSDLVGDDSLFYISLVFGSIEIIVILRVWNFLEDCCVCVVAQISPDESLILGVVLLNFVHET